jgi:hypothetical protein
LETDVRIAGTERDDATAGEREPRRRSRHLGHDAKHGENPPADHPAQRNRDRTEEAQFLTHLGQ